MAVSGIHTEPKNLNQQVEGGNDSRVRGDRVESINTGRSCMRHGNSAACSYLTTKKRAGRKPANHVRALVCLCVIFGGEGGGEQKAALHARTRSDHDMPHGGQRTS